jgi:hypothetical protein
MHVRASYKAQECRKYQAGAPAASDMLHHLVISKQQTQPGVSAALSDAERC